jgi:hypothetical protein
MKRSNNGMLNGAYPLLAVQYPEWSIEFRGPDQLPTSKNAKLRELSPWANYTDGATAAFRRS